MRAAYDCECTDCGVAGTPGLNCACSGPTCPFCGACEGEHCLHQKVLQASDEAHMWKTRYQELLRIHNELQQQVIHARNQQQMRAFADQVIDATRPGDAED